MKHSLLLLLVLLCSSLSAQTTWFSATTGTATETHGTVTGQAAVRLASGEILVAGVGEGFVLDLKRFSAQGDLISRMEGPVITNGLVHITGAELMDGETAMLVSGTAGDASGYERGFFIARIDLSTYMTKYSYRNFASNLYTYAPAVSVTADAIYGVFPLYKYGMVAAFDHNLNPQWCKGFIPDSTDTTWSKHPTMGGFFCDSTIVVSCKDESALSFARFSPSGDLVGYQEFSGTAYTRIYNMSGTADGNFLITGFYDGYFPMIAKITPAGVPIWAKELTLSSVVSFTGAKELPDGRILATAILSTSMMMNEGDGYCIFSADGNLLSSGGFTSEANVWMPMQNLQVYGDGILAAGTRVDYSSSTYTYDNVLQYTDFSFGQVCHPLPVFNSTAYHYMGTSVTVPESGIKVWDITPPTVSTFTLVPGVTTAPVICNLVTAVQAPEAGSFSVYPNPAYSGDEVNLQVPAAGAYTATLSDLHGRIVHSADLGVGQNSLQLPGLAGGVYVLTVRNGVEVLGSQKLIVR